MFSPERPSIARCLDLAECIPEDTQNWRERRELIHLLSELTKAEKK